MRRHTSLVRTLAPTARTFELVAAIAERLALDFGETVAEMDAAAIEAVPALGADAALAAELTANHRGHLRRFLAFARQADSPCRSGFHLRPSMAPAPSRVAVSTSTRSMRATGAASRLCSNAG